MKGQRGPYWISLTGDKKIYFIVFYYYYFSAISQRKSTEMRLT